MGNLEQPITKTEMTHSGELSGPRPWEDRTLTPKQRYDSYMSVLRRKCEEILAAWRREGITQEEKNQLFANPDNQMWKEELQRVTAESPDGLCARLDAELVPKLLGKNFLGAEAWSKGFGVDVGPVPPVPTWITPELLEEDCQLHPGQQVKDTHILMLVPKTVSGAAYSAVKLGELCAKAKGSGDRLIYERSARAKAWQGESWAKESPAESEWVLIPKMDPDPAKVSKFKHFRSKDIAQQAEVHRHYAKDYREAKALEVMTAALLNDVVHGEAILLNCLLRTREPNASGGRVVVGCFNAYGLGVDVDNDDQVRVIVGVALARKS